MKLDQIALPNCECNEGIFKGVACQYCFDVTASNLTGCFITKYDAMLLLHASKWQATGQQYTIMYEL